MYSTWKMLPPFNHFFIFYSKNLNDSKSSDKNFTFAPCFLTIHHNMAHHKSAKKRIRQDIIKRLRNRYYKKSTRTSIMKLREMTDKLEASNYLPKVISLIDKLAKRNLWHKNKASNLKSSLMKKVAQL